MIAKIHQGKGFGGLVGYANDILKKDTVIIAKGTSECQVVCRPHIVVVLARGLS